MMTAHALSPARPARGKLAGSPAASVHAPAPPSAMLQPAGLEVGNLALQELMAGGLRARLEVGGTDDPEEREADALASAVLGGGQGGGRAPCACGGSCEKCAAGQGSIATVVRRKPAEGGAPSRPPAIARAFAGPGRPLDAATRARFEPRFGADLSRVRLHDDARSASMAATIGARAYAARHEIGFARGQFSPNTPAGQALLAHELAHVVMGHGGLRRVGMDDGLSDAEIDRQIEEGRELAAKNAAERAKHEAWSKAVGSQWQNELPEQSKDISEERARLNLALTGVQAKAFDEAGKEGSWLDNQLKAAGYSEPSIGTVKQLWGRALVAADALKLGAEAKPKDQPDAAAGVISPEIRLEAMSLIPAYYGAAKTFGAAVELALKTWADGVNQAAEEAYRKELADYERTDRINDETCKSMRGDLGGGAACGGLRLSQGSPPSRPTPVTIPPPVSTGLEKPMERAGAAQSPAEWGQVAADLHASAIALGKLVTASLPTASPLQKQADAIAALDARLEKFAGEHAVTKRVPAVFYPKDAGQMVKAKDGTESFVADAVPWQFYLTLGSKLDDTDGMCLTQSEWVLHDITNPKAARTTAAASDADAEMVANGKWVDPPISLFTPLNSKLRFPEGELYFTLPSGTSYVHHMTEPWTLSDYLSAAAMFLAAAALVAGVIATGGAAAPAAVALGATIGSAAFGTAATLTEMQEKREHGLLTEKDVDRAMLDIGMNVISVATLGLGRVVTAPGAAVRFGSKFGAMATSLRMLRFVNLGGDIIQASLITADLVQGFQAIDQNPQLSQEQKEKMIASLARRALLTGAMMTVTIRGDINDVRSSGTLHIASVDPDGIPRAGPPVSEEVGPPAPKSHLDADAPQVHAKVAPVVDAAGTARGTGMTLAGQRHALGVAGSGPMRDIYFCSDLCTSAVNRIGAVLEAIPANHPMRPALEDMLQRANRARNQLKSGKITDAEAEEVAHELRDRMARLAQDGDHGTTLQTLFDMNPGVLSANADSVRTGIAKGIDIQTVRGEAEAAFAPSTPLVNLLLQAAGKKPRLPPSWKEADASVMDPSTRALLPDFDRRVSNTGLISSIKANVDADGALGVTIKGEVDPGRLSRNPERIAAGAQKAPSFNSLLRSRLGGLKELGLKGWQRLHLWGPGFGDEAAAGMMLGPTSMNQLWQNGDLAIVSGKKVHFGIEGYIRELAETAKASGGKVKLTAKAEAWGDPTPGGFKSPGGEPVLRRVEYRIELEGPDGTVVRQTTVNMDLPDPSTWKNPNAVKPLISASGDGVP